MSNDDIPNALLALNDLNQGWGFGEHIWQGIVNSIALEQLLRGKLATELLVDGTQASTRRSDARSTSSASRSATSSARRSSPTTRSSRARVLHVGGANWSLMFERSNNWATYGAAAQGQLRRRCSTPSSWSRCSQMALEGVDGATVAGVAIPGTPAKSVPDADLARRHRRCRTSRASSRRARSALTLIIAVRHDAVRLRDAQATVEHRAAT